ncbi:hypothetical protein D3C72_548640 [compost metagenome]
MKKFASVAAAAAALSVLVCASGASAQTAATWSPTVDGWNLSGLLSMNQSVNVDCQLDVEAKTTSTTTGQINSFVLTPAPTLLCSSLTPSSLPWSIEPLKNASTGQYFIRINNLHVTTSLGYCQGDVVGEWFNVPQNLVFTGATVDGKVFGFDAPCTIDGEVHATPARANASSPLIIS